MKTIYVGLDLQVHSLVARGYAEDEATENVVASLKKYLTKKYAEMVVNFRTDHPERFFDVFHTMYASRVKQYSVEGWGMTLKTAKAAAGLVPLVTVNFITKEKHAD